MADSHCPLSQGQESSRRVTSRCCASFPLAGRLGEACTCYSCNFSSSRAHVFHGGYIMTKKRSSLTCDNMEDLVNLHEVLSQVREWETVKKMRLA